MRYQAPVFGGFLMCVLLSWKALADSMDQNINLRPKQQINAESLDYPRFRGNSSQKDFFKLLERDGTSLLVGARNSVYNLSMETLSIQQRLHWSSSLMDVEKCRMKGKNEEDCHNYIRVLVRQSKGKVLICGTNSFHPMCRQYESEEGGYMRQILEFEGAAVSPYDPRHNSTAVYLPDEDVLYSATVSDFAGIDPLIYRKRLPNNRNGMNELRTVRNDPKNSLYDPSFVSSFADSTHVYFWFRETAAEYENVGRAVYGRVGRVCKNDMGDQRNMEWTSYTKARLNCSLPGNSPVHFNELLATSNVVIGPNGRRLVYAVMSGPQNALQMSAVCAFDMDDVSRIFDHGEFKVQETPTSGWYPARKLPTPRPGACVDDSRKLRPDVTSFIKKNPLMDEAVPNFFSQPLLIDSNLRSHFTQISVHSGVVAVSGQKYDVIFMGTDDGKVLKLVNTMPGAAAKSVLLETVRVFGPPQAVRNLMVYAPEEATDSKKNVGKSGRIVVVSDEEVRSLPLYHCGEHSTCGGCVRLQDPYCAWDLNTAKCVGKGDGNWFDGGDYVQSVRTGRADGKDRSCPEGDVDPSLYAVNELYTEKSMGPVFSPRIYTAERMAIAVVVTLAIASTIGFVVGYRLSRWKILSDGASSTSGSDYDGHSYGRSRLTKHDGSALKHLDAYSCPPITAKLKDTAPMSLVLSMPPDSNLKPEKNLLTLNNGTLPKDYKVKKVYL